jgi:hypothetical protein
MSFEEYLKKAMVRANEDALKGRDSGDLKFFSKLCRTGVKKNWKALDSSKFFEMFHRCIAASGKRVETLNKYLEGQKALFRRLSPSRIVRDQREIRRGWRKNSQYLSPRMVDAMIEVAKRITERGWPAFKSEYLLLPSNPETESLEEWVLAHEALKRLPMVGYANGWYLIRNLYGARAIKPDVWIMRIAARFLPKAKSPLGALTEAVRESWRRVCPDEPMHLGRVDYILWWYAQATGQPKAKVHATC